MPPRPIVDFSPISMVVSPPHTAMRSAPGWSGGFVYTASTSVSSASPSASDPAATSEESLSLSENTRWVSSSEQPVTTSFSLMMGTAPSEVRRSSVSVRYE
jgi:hypothetical protein